MKASRTASGDDACSSAVVITEVHAAGDRSSDVVGDRVLAVSGVGTEAESKPGSPDGGG